MALRWSVVRIVLLFAPFALACAGKASMDYSSADPIADARAAFARGNFHLVGVQVGDSVVSPIDSAYAHTQVNVTVGPDGPIRFLALVEDAGAPHGPSRAQLSYMKRFNTEMFRMLEENAHPHRRS